MVDGRSTRDGNNRYRRESWIFYMRKIYHFIGLSSGPRFISGRHSGPHQGLAFSQPLRLGRMAASVYWYFLSALTRSYSFFFPLCPGRLSGWQSPIQPESSHPPIRAHRVVRFCYSNRLGALRRRAPSHSFGLTALLTSEIAYLYALARSSQYPYIGLNPSPGLNRCDDHHETYSEWFALPLQL